MNIVPRDFKGQNTQGPQAHLGKTDLVPVTQPLSLIRGVFLSKQDKDILSMVMKYWTREMGVPPFKSLGG